MKKFIKWLFSTTPREQNPQRAGVGVGLIILLCGLFMFAVTLDAQFLNCLWMAPLAAILLPGLG